MSIFIVTSVIKSRNRTFFTQEQRLEQTIETAKSIRKYCPNAYTILVDSHLEFEQKNRLSIHFDLVLVTENEQATSSSNISAGEIYLINYALNVIHEMSIPGGKIYKLSGRYKLTEDFKDENFPNDSYGFGTVNQCYYTTLFSIPYAKVLEFKNYIQSISFDIEHDLYNRVPKDEVKLLNVLGCEGLVGTNGDYFKQ